MKKVCSLAFKTFLLFCFSVFCGCKGKDDNAIILQQIDEGLVQSNNLIRMNTEEIIQSLRYKIDDPRTAEKAKIILPKAQFVMFATSNTLRYIDSLKTSRTVVSIEKENKLFDKLWEYKTAVLSADKKLSHWFGDSFLLFNKEIDTTNNGREKLRKLISRISKSDFQNFLSRIQNNLIIDEYKTIRLLNEQTAYHDDGFYETFNAIIGQNAKVLQTGDNLEITAGVGKFSKRALATIIINGDSIQTGDRGIVIKKIKTSDRPGNHSLPVIIKFTDEEGKEQTHSFTVEYKTVSPNLK